MNTIWTLVFSLVGAITGTLGAVSGLYAFILSGYRVKAHVGLAIRTTNGGYVQLDPDWTGGFDLQQNYVPGSESLFIQALNSGRSKIEIGQLVIKNYRKKATDDAHSYYLFFGPPYGADKMPYLLDFGTSCAWLIPLHEVISLSNGPLDEPKNRKPIFVELRLGDRTAIQSENSLTPDYLDSFEVEWSEYQRKTL